MATEELKNTNQIHKEFQSLLDQDFKDRKLKENEIIKATVTEITKNFIVVDCKAKMEGMIPIEEFKNDNELEKLKVGSQIDVYLERIESFKGEIIISRDKARKMKTWRKMEKVFETQEEMTGYITGKVKGGFITNVEGLPCFMPSSQIDVRPLKKIDHLMNTPLKVIATRLDKNRGNVCVSRRAVLEKSKNAEITEALKNIKEGDIVDNAIVKATTDWGIFLEINGIDALLHVSDLSHGRVKKPSDLVTIGQKLKVKITKIDEKTNRVSASVKALTVDPFDNLEKKYKIGEIYEGVVTKLMDYGCFVKIEEGIEGLIHNSELDWTNRNIHPSKVVSVGDEVEVMILEIDEDRRRISLGIKQCKPNPWEQFEISNEKGQRIKGNIKSITDFGIFLGLDGGIDGLVHLSDISWTEPGEEAVRNYSKGEEIETLILSVDAERERISLGIKQLEKDPFADFLESNSRGSVVKAKVLEIEEREATLELAADVLVVLKSSDMSVDRVDDARKVLSQGDEIEVKLTNVDSKNRHIGVSIKAIAIDEERQAVRDHKKKEDVKSGSATIGDLIKAEMEKGEED